MNSKECGEILNDITAHFTKAGELKIVQNWIIKVVDYITELEKKDKIILKFFKKIEKKLHSDNWSTILMDLSSLKVQLKNI